MSTSKAKKRVVELKITFIDNETPDATDEEAATNLKDFLIDDIENTTAHENVEGIVLRSSHE